jgi:hypothetical protein
MHDNIADVIVQLKGYNGEAKSIGGKAVGDRMRLQMGIQFVV